MIRLLIPLALIAVPLIEIALFIEIGGRIGFLATIAVVIGTAMIGTVLLRLQGVAALREAQKSLDKGEIPVMAVVDGIGLLAAGLLLLTPGFLTDAIGFLLFVPQFRRAVALLVWQWVSKHGSVEFSASYTRSETHHSAPDRGEVIEGDYAEVDGEEKDGGTSRNRSALPGSPWRNGDGRKP